MPMSACEMLSTCHAEGESEVPEDKPDNALLRAQHSSLLSQVHPNYKRSHVSFHCSNFWPSSKSRHTFLILHVIALRMLVILSHRVINDIKMTSFGDFSYSVVFCYLSAEEFFGYLTNFGKNHIHKEKQNFLPSRVKDFGRF